MKRFFTKYGMTVLALAAAIAVILSVMTYFSSTAAVLPNLAGIVAAPFRNAGATVTEKVNDWLDYLTNYDALKAENEALKLRIAQMEEENRQAKYRRPNPGRRPSGRPPAGADGAPGAAPGFEIRLRPGGGVGLL